MNRDTSPLRPPMESQRTERTRGVHRHSNHPGLLGAIPSARRRRVADAAGARATHAAPALNQSRGGLSLAFFALAGFALLASAGVAFGPTIGITVAATALLVLLGWTLLVSNGVDRGVVALPQDGHAAPDVNAERVLRLTAQLRSAGPFVYCTPEAIKACEELRQRGREPYTFEEFSAAWKLYEQGCGTSAVDVKA